MAERVVDRIRSIGKGYRFSLGPNPLMNNHFKLIIYYRFILFMFTLSLDGGECRSCYPRENTREDTENILSHSVWVGDWLAY
jgi:hypothetical protein